MKIYTIAQESSECYGHGSYGKEWVINTTKCYGLGDYPPCFLSEKEAKEYMKTCDWEVLVSKKVVSLELVSEKEIK